MQPRPHESFVSCSHCQGTGADPKKRKRDCPACKGSKVEARCRICRKEVRGSIVDPTNTYCNCYSIEEWMT